MPRGRFTGMARPHRCPVESRDFARVDLVCEQRASAHHLAGVIGVALRAHLGDRVLHGDLGHIVIRQRVRQHRHDYP